MSRLSRAKKREQRAQLRAAGPAAPATAPIDVRVPVAGPGAGGASIGGVPVAAAPGEEIQHAVLSHLHRIVLATGHPVQAIVHDERIGYVVPLRVETDGSSHFTAEPVRMGAAAVAGPGAPGAGAEASPGAPQNAVWPPAEPRPPQNAERPSVDSRLSQGAARPPAEPHPPQNAVRPPTEPQPPQSTAQPPAEPQPPRRDKPTQLLRPANPPARDPAPTFPLRAVPEPVQDAVPGTVSPPLGEFGPPPPMDARPDLTDVRQPDQSPEPTAPVPDYANPTPIPDYANPTPTPLPIPTLSPSQPPPPASTQPPPPNPSLDLASTSHPDPDPKPTPPRGFDAVAEAVLGDAPPVTADASPLTEPMARISEAVKEGRTEAAAELAEGTVVEASVAFGAEHADVLRLRELTAYIAYLAGDPVRAFGLSLGVAQAHHRTRDAEAAYSSVQSAATAWRAVRDPEQGLRLGRDLIGLWAELADGDGPAAEDVEQLESARVRMDRLAARAAKSAGPPTS
ncbi:chromosomal replication initiator protein DnaA [Streptomyces dysideae]|uniref:Uncharacterized protein n=1 Tax=Streptomyces dysideae TaxID=909626 RepID=A0A101V236_9ACTN|nr:hypothetical protein [Streptomyces dysideae]KUO21038.1 hypothetical protein AQJ91_11285 [Streptomyces dysideae]